MKRSIGAVLGAALCAASFLCVGMGMDMGVAYAEAPAHECCPGGAPERQEGGGPSCCLLMPAATASSVGVPAPLFVGVLVASLSETPVFRTVAGRSAVFGPPGVSPGFVVPASPRAPPAA